MNFKLFSHKRIAQISLLLRRVSQLSFNGVVPHHSFASSNSCWRPFYGPSKRSGKVFIIRLIFKQSFENPCFFYSSNKSFFIVVCRFDKNDKKCPRYYGVTLILITIQLIKLFNEGQYMYLDIHYISRYSYNSKKGCPSKMLLKPLILSAQGMMGNVYLES